MFSGKTEELLRRLRRAEYARLKTLLCKPVQDKRYAEDAVVSHDATRLPSVMVRNSTEVLQLAQPYQVVGIDEAQFLDDGIVEVANLLANKGKRVVLAGLDMDYTGKPFGPMPQLMAVAEFVTKLHAICVRTGDLAHFSHRMVRGRNEIQVGGAESYEPLSRRAFMEIQEAEKAAGVLFEEK
jgi:thymidine kinase